MQHIAEILLWCCIAAVLAVYFGYPMSLALLGGLGRRRIPGEVSPYVTIVISAYNEAAIIRDKIENTLILDYPTDQLEIIVVSDASEDATDGIVAEYADRGVVLCRQQLRRGKSAALTQFVPQARGDIIVFSDANSLYEPDAIRRLVNHFSDPNVGYVVGHQRYVESRQAASVSESLYWRYETWIKGRESRFGSVVGGDGAIYAIRAALFEPLRDDDINDFVIPLKIIAKGFSGIFEPKAVCYERTADSFRGEFRRKVRIVNRSLRAVCRVPQVLNPFHVGVFAYQLALHKVVRWFVPFFLVSILLLNIGLAASGGTIYGVLLGIQIVFYVLAALSVVPWLRRRKLVYLPYYFCLVNAASGLGVLTLLSRKRFTTWSPQRPSDELAETRMPSSVCDSVPCAKPVSE